MRQALELADAHRVGARRDLEKCWAAQDKVLDQNALVAKGAAVLKRRELSGERVGRVGANQREGGASNSRMASEHCKACEEDYFAAEEAAEVALHALECARE